MTPLVDSKIEFRLAAAGDEDLAAPIVLEFFKEYVERLGLPLNSESVRKFIDYFTGKYSGALAIVAVEDEHIIGFLAGVISPWMLDNSKTSFEEVGWFVSRPYRQGTVGIRMFQFLEETLKSRDVFFFHMGSFTFGDEAVESFYERKGFKPIEKKWIKLFKPEDPHDGQSPQRSTSEEEKETSRR